MGEWSAPWSVKVGRNGAFSVVNSDDYPVCRIVHWTPPADEKEARLIAAAPDLFEALAKLTEMYVKLAGSGDCGFWNPEKDPEVIDARAALIKASEGER